MRVIAGIYRGRVLKSPPDSKTRPTSDRLRETLFNILNPRITEDTIFLDLCAGTGAIGIEAISRGVQKTIFVELARRNCAIIEENLDNLEIPEEQTEVICEKAEKFLLKTKTEFDIVYFDPPYKEDYVKVLMQFGTIESNLLKINGVFIAEHSVKTNLPDLVGELRRWRILKQGDSALSFYEKN
ncbi:MAG: 16S rRNA (guanine(966)-N(2))-methyltransferase RsmD [Acidobacteriota bacterium]